MTRDLFFDQAVSVDALQEDLKAALGDAVEGVSVNSKGTWVYVRDDAAATDEEVAALVTAHDPAQKSSAQLRLERLEAILADVSVADVRALVTAYDNAATVAQVKASLRPILVLLLKAAVASGSIASDQVSQV